MEFNIIAAMDRNNGIGYKNKLPWKLIHDMQCFKEKTTRTEDVHRINAVIMGRKTYDSFPETSKPLPGRINVIISRQTVFAGGAVDDLDKGLIVCRSLSSALARLNEGDLKEIIESVWVIGGQQIYESAIRMPNLNTMHLTIIDKDYNCDTFFPEFKKDFEQINKPLGPFEENNTVYRIYTYKRKEMEVNY